MARKSLEKQLAPELGMDPNNLSQEDKDKIEIIFDVVMDWQTYHENRGSVHMAGGWRPVYEDLFKREGRGEQF